jgi:hypothetical protein
MLLLRSSARSGVLTSFRQKEKKGVSLDKSTHLLTTSSAQGVGDCLTIFIADTFSLLNRPLMRALATSPYIVSIWMGSPITASIVAGIGWGWGFGFWTIVSPIVVLLLCALFLWNQRKAVKSGLTRAAKSQHVYGNCQGLRGQEPIFSVVSCWQLGWP